jgi:hypothetical protein
MPFGANFKWMIHRGQQKLLGEAANDIFVCWIRDVFDRGFAIDPCQHQSGQQMRRALHDITQVFATGTSAAYP